MEESKQVVKEAHDKLQLTENPDLQELLVRACEKRDVVTVMTNNPRESLDLMMTVEDPTCPTTTTQTIRTPLSKVQSLVNKLQSIVAMIHDES